MISGEEFCKLFQRHKRFHFISPQINIACIISHSYKELWLQKADLEAHRAELINLIKQTKTSEAMVEKVPLAIKTFEDAFNNLDPRQQKAPLQTILKAAYIFNDGWIELEFRGESA